MNYSSNTEIGVWFIGQPANWFLGHSTWQQKAENAYLISADAVWEIINLKYFANSDITHQQNELM